MGAVKGSHDDTLPPVFLSNIRSTPATAPPAPGHITDASVAETGTENLQYTAASPAPSFLSVSSRSQSASDHAAQVSTDGSAAQPANRSLRPIHTEQLVLVLFALAGVSAIVAFFIPFSLFKLERDQSRPWQQQVAEWREREQ